jgi:pimeloyl-ACP methyl ester carboxylesterase
MQTVLAGSPPDQHQLDDDEIFEAILRGSEIAIGPKFMAHAAYAAGVIASHGSDWSQSLASCPVPMILYSGHQDPLSPFETMRDYAAITPNITLYDFPEYGALLYPIWPQIFAEIARRVE